MPERDDGAPADESPDGYDPDVTVSRADVELGGASEADFAAADTAPVADESERELLDRLDAEAATERQRAVLALSERDPGEDAVATLSDIAGSDPDALVRQFAVETLGEVAGPTPEAVMSACDDADPWVRAEAIVALDHLDRAGHVERIEAALEDDHHAVRRNAAIALWKGRGEDALPALRTLADDESERVREWVAELLGRIDHPDAELPLIDLQNDDESIVAKTAAHALDSSDSTPAASGQTGSGGTDPRGPGDQPPQL